VLKGKKERKESGIAEGWNWRELKGWDMTETRQEPSLKGFL
jgi:hypothetical protein